VDSSAWDCCLLLEYSCGYQIDLGWFGVTAMPFEVKYTNGLEKMRYSLFVLPSGVTGGTIASTSDCFVPILGSVQQGYRAAFGGLMGFVLCRPFRMTLTEQSSW
jgi:hypothetical protein